MINNEKELTAEVSKYLRFCTPPKQLQKSYLVEYKYLKKSSLNFERDFEDQQLPMLYECKHHGVYYKMSDDSRSRKPCDAFFIKGGGWVAIGIEKEVYYFDIDKIYKIKENYCGLKKETVKHLADFKIELKNKYE